MSSSRHYDVFLSYNSADRPAVEYLANELQQSDLEPFLDKWHLIPGDPWQEAIEEALDRSHTCAILIGPQGISPWEHEEMRAAIEQRVADRAFRVIPVLLPGAIRGERGRLPAFLARVTWVEFRESLDEHDAFRRLVAGIRGTAPGSGSGDVVYEEVCPYRGLQVFEEEHAPFFFGRQATTEWLVNDLRNSRFLAVVGPSGSGKSSLVRAGLVPALRRGNVPGSEAWPLYVFRPGTRPLESLAVALVRMSASPGDLRAVSQLMDALSTSGRQLHLAARLALDETLEDSRLVLIVDQFEEIFTLCHEEAQRRVFIENLLYASAIEGGQTLVVLTLRADFYGKCAAYPDLAARFTDHQMLVSPMTEEELREAIVRPAQMVGLEFERGLPEALLHDVQAEPGALPLLQHTLLELWERREVPWLTFGAYQEIGGIRGAIAHRADSIYAEFDEAERTIAKRIMLRLTQPGEGTEDTRRRVSKVELLPTDEQSQLTEDVIQVLSNARLLTTTRDMATGTEQVDVAHEALVRGWPRLQEWIEEDRAGWRTLRQLTTAAREWADHGRDESYLYRGLRLSEAEAWAEEHRDELNQLEAEFFEKSASLRDQEKAEQEHQRELELTVARMQAEEAEAKRRAEEERALEAEAQFHQQLQRSKRLRQLAIATTAITVVAVGIVIWQLLFGRPEPMTGEFNIAIAEFGFVDQSGELVPGRPGRELANDLSDRLEEYLSAREVGLQIQVSSSIGRIKGQTPGDRARVAAELASATHADIVIYGVATEVALDWMLTPEFYVFTGDSAAEFVEKAGLEELGRPIRLAVPKMNPEKRVMLSQELTVRATYILFVTLGQYYYSSGDFLPALEYWRQAEAAYLDSQLVPYEGLYVLQGDAALGLAGAESSAKTLATVSDYYSRTLAINPSNPWALLGEANVRYLMALGDVGSPGVDSAQLDEAVAFYRQAQDEARGTPSQANIEASVSFGMGRVELVHAMMGGDTSADWLSQAKGHFEQVVAAYAEGAIQLRDLTAAAYAQLALLAQEAHEVESAISLYARALDLASPYKRGIYFAALGDLYALIGDSERAIEAYEKAVSDAALYGGQKAVQEYGRRLQELK